MPRTTEQLRAVAEALTVLVKANGHTPRHTTEEEYGEKCDTITLTCETCEGGMTATVWDDRVQIRGLDQKCEPGD